MNMIAVEVVSDSQGQRVVAGGVSLPLDPRVGVDAQRADATLGIRPEDISLLAPGASEPAAVDAQVTMVEPLGPEFLLSFVLNEQEIIAKIAGRALPRIGDRLRVAFNMAHAHLFDTSTGQSMLRRNTRQHDPG